MRIHLVTYATPRFRLRQLILGWSALANQIVDTVTHWSPEKLQEAGFESRCPGIKLSERGSGFWAWKPFVIDLKLQEVVEGDIVFYCDVGRLYPFKLLNQTITPYLQWMNKNGQDIMPGVKIPWDGPNSAWIKREALVAHDMDRPEVHLAAPIQASFSLWRVSTASRNFVEKWLHSCSQRPLVSDDASRHGLTELSGFRGHRHDQALLTLHCIASGIDGLGIGTEKPHIDSRHPSQVSRIAFGVTTNGATLAGRMLNAFVKPIELSEKILRQNLKFGKTFNE
jgi:hypothetical protein